MTRIYVFVAALLVICCFPLQAMAESKKQVEQIEAHEQSIGYKREDPVSEATMLKVGAVSIFGALLAVATLIVLKKFLVKLPVGAGKDDRIQLCAVKRISPKLMLLLARVDDREYLIAQSGEKVCVTPHREVSLEKSGVCE